jgi:hypothetical protein
MAHARKWGTDRRYEFPFRPHDFAVDHNRIRCLAMEPHLTDGFRLPGSFCATFYFAKEDIAMRNQFVKLFWVAAILTITGCALQSKIIKHRHWELNETISKTHIENSC